MLRDPDEYSRSRGLLVDLDCAVFVGGRGQLGPKGYAKVRMVIVDHVVYSLSRARL